MKKEEKLYLTINWDNGRYIEVYQLSKEGVEAYKEGRWYEYMAKKFCNINYVLQHSTHVVGKKPTFLNQLF